LLNKYYALRQLGKNDLELYKKARQINPKLEEDPKFQPLPAPNGYPAHHLSLEDILSTKQMVNIFSCEGFSFHTVGNTGGIRNPAFQQSVANAMVNDFKSNHVKVKPKFLYHLGDIVYYHGESSHYHRQFYEPYKCYPAPIFAIPGNHDGSVNPHYKEPSLYSFVNNFCVTGRKPTRKAGDIQRDALTQPNVYWTLEAPFVRIMGKKISSEILRYLF
jgi:hypothetical protein